jgi:diguanylate cyclase (GGDEF)-like protein
VANRPIVGDVLAGGPARYRRQLVALSVVFGLIGSTLIGLSITHLRPLASQFHLSWFILAFGFAVAESFPITAELGDGHVFPLIELPLVLGLFLVSPFGLVLAWITGRGLAGVTGHARSWAWLGASLGGSGVQATAALVCFHTLLGSSPGFGPASWGPALVAALVATLLGTGCAWATKRAGGGHVKELPHVRLTVFGCAAAPIATTMVALAATALLGSQPNGVWLVAGTALVLVLVYHGYAGLATRCGHLRLLHDFMKLVDNSTERAVALQTMLTSMREMLKADVAELLLVTEDLAAPATLMVLGLAGVVETKTVASVHAAGPLWERAIGEEKSIRVRSLNSSKKLRAMLVAESHRDCMVVTLRSKGRIVGALKVADRTGALATFKQADLEFFEAFAEQALVLLEKSSLFNRLQLAAWHDELTGLTNRAAFNEQVTDAIKARRPNTKIALLLIDLDRFKEVNDTLGHHQGDRVLIGVALRLTRALRPPATLARLGGDEFAVLLADVQDDNEPLAVAQRLRRVIDEPFLLGDLRVSVGATIGIALCPDHGEDIGTLLQRADVAMYSAKGGGGIATYSLETDTLNPVRQALINDLRHAIDHGELELYYQPQMELGSGAVVGAEALLRWNHPVAGFIPPQEFVEVAERSDLIRPLTLFVLQTATTQWRAWQDAGLDVMMSVKLSVRNLVDPNLRDDIAAFLLEADMPASRLTLEITESVIMSDRKFVIVQGLASLGVALSIGDFGTGVSSLAYLKRLPVRQIKIDRSFVRTMESDHGDRAIVHAVVELATSLGMRVIAEGVETQAAFDLLTALGCPVAQGFFLTPPLPAPDFVAWTTARSYPAAATAGKGGLRVVQ